MAENTFDSSLAVLPYNVEAEQSVLGAVLIDIESLDIIFHYIKDSKMFHTKQHQMLFDCISQMYHYGKPIDIITLAEEAQKNKIFADLSEAHGYLGRLAATIPTTANLEGYLKIVVDKYIARQIILTSNDLINKASDSKDANSILDIAEQRFIDIRQGKDSSDLELIHNIVIEYYDLLGKMSIEDQSNHKPISTGFASIDSIITGLNRSDLILIAGRPGMGKTSLGINIATNVAFKQQVEVVIFSLEMSNEQLVSRILSSRANIRSEKFRTANLTTDEWIALSVASDELARQPMYLDDTPDITVGQMKAKLKKLKNLGLVIIDYLQLMSSGQRSENRVQEISQITRSLKILAKELDVPVILLSQLSRATEQRQGNRPMLSDLRESGSIEQDADIVLFLYREGYYNKECEFPNLAKCIVAKNRHGSVADADLMWNGERTTFTDAEFIYNEENY